MKRWLALITLLPCLLVAVLATPAAAQDSDDIDSLSAIQATLRGFAAWWGSVARPDTISVEYSRGDDGAFVMGSPDAPITLIEFADFACPHCQRYRPAISQFIETYVETGRARLEFRFFPTAGGEMTILAAQAAECADEQRPGAFWQAHELLYEYALSGRYTSRIPGQLAGDLALDEAAILACMETADQIAIDVAFARAVGVSGTPAILIRYAGGLPQFIEVDGVTYNVGGPDFGILSAAVEQSRFR